MSNAATARRLIGGVFGLEHATSAAAHVDKSQRPFLRPEAVYLVNAHSAFFVLVRMLAPGRVWLPSYLCGSVAAGFESAGGAIAFFAVDAFLRCADTDWLAQVRPGDIVLRTHYFGFPNRDPILAAAGGRGGILIEDAAQALLTPGLDTLGGSYLVYSPRKFLGLPDGGCLVPIGPKTSVPPPPLEAPPADWLESAHAVVRSRRKFDEGGMERDWFPEFQRVERTAPTGAYAMSETSRRLIHSGLDYEAIEARRRRNYQQLAGRIGEFALFPNLPDAVVPLGFPVVIEDRNRVRQALFEEQIFPAVHWALDGVVPAAFVASHELAQSVMTLPCDQRYDDEDMQRTADVFQRARPRFRNAVGR